MKRLIALTTVSLLLAPAAHAWGPAAHQRVMSEVIDTLPGDLKSFYKQHKLELPTLALDAEPADEGLDRRFALDRLASFPYTDLARSEAALKEKIGEEAAAAAGRLPWLIQESYGRLVEAYRKGDKTQILTESDLIAGYVTDLHNPLALSDNADGQKTGQHGLWVRFGTRLPESMQSHLKVSSDAAHYLDDPREHVFSMAAGTLVWLDNILYREDLARRSAPGFTELYYEALGARIGPIVKDLLSAATSEAGSYWYTAWTEAGRPKLQ